MRCYRNILSILVVTSFFLVGCDLTKPMSDIFTKRGSAGKATKRGEMQMEHDPVSMVEKSQQGIHYDPRRWVEEHYNPANLATSLTSDGRKGITRQTFAEVGGDHNIHVSDDGRWMAFSTTRYSSAPQICLQSVTGKAVTLLTEDNMSDMMPKISPKGNEIAWCSNRTGNWDIWVQRTDKLPNKQLTQITRSTDDDVHPTWSPMETLGNGERGSRLLAFSRFNSMDGMWQIWIMDYHNRTVSNITEGLFPEFCPVLKTADGRTIYKIAYQRNRNRDVPFYSIWTIDVSMSRDGKVEAVGAPQEIISDRDWAAITPAWSPDGNYLVFATVRKSPLAQFQARLYKADDIFVVRLDGTDLTQITSHSAPDWDPYWAKDPADPGGPGRIYFVSNRSGQPNIWSAKPVIAGLMAKARMTERMPESMPEKMPDKMSGEMK